MSRMHEVNCVVFNDKFGGNSKLRTHMCRVQVTNPTHLNLYMKNWYTNKACIRLFCENEQKQLAILHSEECERGNPCHDSPPDFID